MRHLSYVETGRSRPSPEMIAHLARYLDIPLREQNKILLAAGYAPRYSMSSPTVANDDRGDGVARAISQIISAHTLPAVVVDAQWDLVAANPAAAIFLTDISPLLLQPPINVIRLSLHPDGLAPRVVNFTEYAAHVLHRIERVTERYDPNGKLQRLLEEFGNLRARDGVSQHPGILLPLELMTSVGIVRMFSTISTFGSPLDATLEELAIETFYPSDPESADRLTRSTAASESGIRTA
jgi:transcriptional regulator with XRE-family HTH domain